ncbi:MAG: radical SAM protein [Acidobacteriota bacterium]|nr:radical SAM protein [Acidobacteriota bacterium]
MQTLLVPTLDAIPAFRRPADDYTFDVKYYGGDRVETERALAAAASDVHAADAISLYLHFPLCPYICRFCHYHVRARTGRSMESSPILADLHSCAAVAAASLPTARTKRVSSIYLGGGTPSLLRTDELAALLRWARDLFDCSSVDEITVETTPDSVTREWLEAAHALGVTRVSSGVQALDDEMLAFMGRRHTTADVHRFLEDCRTVSTLTINVDLIAGLPLVTEESWLRTVQELAEHRPASITLYRLRLGRSDERQSSLAHLFAQDPDLFPNQERVAVQLLAARSVLLESGYREGPVGWFWRDAGQPKCYRDRWLLDRPLIGIGESAYSYGTGWQIINAKGSTFQDILQTKRWPALVSTLLSPEERQLRHLAWRLRATGKVPALRAGEWPQLQTTLDHLEALGLLKALPEGGQHLTELGTLLLDEIIRRVLHLRTWDRGGQEAPGQPFSEVWFSS